MTKRLGGIVERKNCTHLDLMSMYRYDTFLKKNLNASRPSCNVTSIPHTGGKMSKRLGGRKKNVYASRPSEHVPVRYTFEEKCVRI